MRLNSKEAQEDAVQREMFRLRQLPTILKTSNTLHKVLEFDAGSRMMGNKMVRVWHMPQKPRSWMDVMKELHASGKADDGGEETTGPEQPSQGDVTTVRVGRGGQVGRFRGHRGLGPPGRTPLRPLTRPMRNLVESDGELVRPQRDIGLPDILIAKTGDGQPYETVDSAEVEGKGDVHGQKRTLQESPGFPTSPFFKASPQEDDPPPDWNIEWLPQIILTDCDEPLSSTITIQPSVPLRTAPPPAVKELLFPPIPVSAQPASPPFEHAKLLDQHKQDHLPVYWDWLLSKRVCEWLDDDASTTSTQTELTHILLRSTDNQMQPLRYEAKDFEKVKLTRLSISPDADTERSKNPAIQGPPEQRDWFVFEVQHRNVIVASMEMDEDGVPVEEPEQDPEDFPEDYWLLAIPVCAVLDSKSTVMELGGGGVLQTTVWTVGVEGFVPCLHGRGVEERFAEGFVNAYADAKGVVEFASIY
ncbi:hypothetical protein M409DRAFT_19679 [Zasmidium cellare ATCC 36951]|uniref:Uncharacterized protein n=1 Tax=Zasmidium cellare ATCC 36951 TaxID=1080233 RepID=A0A6A6CSK2_ZASCE|nr:uncharacterized protein M409DRAFT_19679 [Zasmidium cellare ATCC 36951]KAF2170071.1 hypothetical protein M409DRAFT_19679 [Zasmidium cellare ATCC 36951]